MKDLSSEQQAFLLLLGVLLVGAGYYIMYTGLGITLSFLLRPSAQGDS